jgi:rubrerythrin
LDTQKARAGLVRLLQAAYSGEKAAACAYRGHWRSVSDPGERERIRTIEAEEWHHRDLVGGMLEKLGAGPDRGREFRAGVVGRTLGALCHVSGWFAPMYGAGAIEKHNIAEYEEACALAAAAGHGEFLECLARMADVEREHEAYFRARVTGHWLTRVVPLWPAPPARARQPADAQ